MIGLAEAVLQKRSYRMGITATLQKRPHRSGLTEADSQKRPHISDLTEAASQQYPREATSHKRPRENGFT